MFPSGMNTYAGLIVVVISLAAQIFGWHVSSSEQLNSTVLEGLNLIGAVYAFYGRAKASTPGFLVKNDAPVVTPPAQ